MGARLLSTLAMWLQAVKGSDAPPLAQAEPKWSVVVPLFTELAIMPI